MPYYLHQVQHFLKQLVFKTALVKVGLVKVLFVTVCVPVKVATVLAIFSVKELPDHTESIPVPPAIVNVSLPVPIEILPLSVFTGKVPIILSAYATIDCCVATLVALSDAILSSSNTAVPLTAVLKTPLVIVGVVRVLFC